MNMDIADITYAPGFEYPTHFNNFFKRLTGTNPKRFGIGSLKFLIIGLIIIISRDGE